MGLSRRPLRYSANPVAPSRRRLSQKRPIAGVIREAGKAARSEPARHVPLELDFGSPTVVGSRAIVSLSGFGIQDLLGKPGQVARRVTRGVRIRC